MSEEKQALLLEMLTLKVDRATLAEIHENRSRPVENKWDQTMDDLMEDDDFRAVRRCLSRTR